MYQAPRKGPLRGEMSRLPTNNVIFTVFVENGFFCIFIALITLMRKNGALYSFLSLLA